MNIILSPHFPLPDGKYTHYLPWQTWLLLKISIRKADGERVGERAEGQNTRARNERTEVRIPLGYANEQKSAYNWDTPA